MEQPSISQDDIMDVMEMTDRLESHMSDVLKETQTSLALSALMSSSINYMMAQCKTLEDVMLYRNIFMQILDSAISDIKIKKTHD